VIHFPMPRSGERRLIWQQGFPPNVTLEPAIDLRELSTRHKLSGAMIMNVVRHACLRALAEERTTILASDLGEGIRREFAKENRLE